MKRPMLLFCLCAVVLMAVWGAGAPSKEIPVTTSSKEALATYTKAMDLFDNIRLDDARMLLRKTVETDPSFALAHAYLASIEPTTQARNAAIAKALALGDKVSDGERLIIQGVKASIDGNSVQVEQLLRKAITQYPGDRRCRLMLGQLLMGLQRFDDALAVLNELITIAPEYAAAYNLIGYTHARQDNLDAAEKSLKKYVILLPNEPNPHDSYAEILMKRGKYDESIKQYYKALEIDPRFFLSYSGIVSNHLFKKEFAEAKNVARKFRDIAPDDSWKRTAITDMIRIHLFEGNDEKALEEAAKRLELAAKANDDILMRNDHVLISQIGLHMGGKESTKDMYLKTGALDAAKIIEARTHLDEYLKLNEHAGTSAEAKEAARNSILPVRVELAIREYNLDLARKYVRDYQTWAAARNIKMEMQTAHYLAGRVSLAEGNNAEALKEFEQGNMRNPWNLYWLMETHTLMGDTKKAQDIRSKILNFNESVLSLAMVRSIVTQ